MKHLALATALAAVFASSPALAQTPPPAEPKEGTLRIEGVEPSKVLGAIDTEKLVKDEQQAAQPQEPLAKSADANGVTTKPDPNDKTTSDVESAATGAVGVDASALPVEVAEAVADGKYTTKDLVQAQLEAVQRSPVITPTTVNTTVMVNPPADSGDSPPAEPPTTGAPVFDGQARPGDWSQSAGAPGQPG